MVGRQRGFTLVELAIVLVIIGLILGMAFKGKDLIDGAKAKNMQAQYNKVMAGFNTFYEKYGFYPGDGCAAAAPANVAACTGARNGILDTANEQAASLSLLQTTGILTNADIQSVFGQPWRVAAGGTGNTLTNINYLTVGGVNTNAADARYVCQLDRMMDDGVYNAGIVRSNGNGGGTHQYGVTTDCWSLSSQMSIGIRLLP